MESIIYWNIRHGGGSRGARIVETLLGHRSDLCILGEFRKGRTGGYLQQELQNAGFVHSYLPRVFDSKTNTVAAFSREPMSRIELPRVPATYSHRLICLRAGKISVLGCYFPVVRAELGSFWEVFLQVVQEMSSQELVVLGDFNTVREAEDLERRFTGSRKIEKLVDFGLVDVPQYLGHQLEPTWFSNTGNGFRIDLCFASSSVARQITSFTIEHEPRESGCSDHGLLRLGLG